MFRAVASSSCRLIPAAFRASAYGRRISTAPAHSMLAKALDSKIKHITQSRPVAPPEFPFEIEHPLGGDVSMTRELDGEEIEIEVKLVDEESNSNSSVCLEIDIYKPDGKSMNFEATASANDIVIQKLTTRDGDYKVICSEMCIEPESELQTVLGEFLHARGIEKSVAAFLCDYTLWNSQKSNRHDVEILEKMKKVITDW
ncbi:hypothetical protein SASPL_117425 [Salvia splendens]|uniref:Uncharacterized protein n=1 Tax=Salvia splendens TaxID=180675 RepID=A0A8X8ZY55_SALSN|nr:uncharacterized protein LOC121807782 [Salvia splendens]KAG6420881.1 hypothetical protein SASPL_117425 [Salvia splendens]